MFEQFPIKCIAIILDIKGNRPSKDGKGYLEHVKNAIIPTLRKLETDDLLYLYRDYDNLEMFKTIEEGIGHVCNYKYEKIHIHTAVEESFVLLNQYDNANKGIFLFTDNYRGKSDGLLNMLLQIDKKDNCGCEFFFYGIGTGYGTSLAEEKPFPRYHFTHVDDPSENLSHFFNQDMENSWK